MSQRRFRDWEEGSSPMRSTGKHDPYKSAYAKTPRSSKQFSRSRDVYYPDTPTLDNDASWSAYAEYDHASEGEASGALNASWYQTETKPTLLEFDPIDKRRPPQNLQIYSNEGLQQQNIYTDGVPSPTSSVQRIWVGGEPPDAAHPPKEGFGSKVRSWFGNRRRSKSTRSRSSTLQNMGLADILPVHEESPEAEEPLETAYAMPTSHGYTTPTAVKLHGQPQSRLITSENMTLTRFQRYTDPNQVLKTPERPKTLDPRSPAPAGGVRPDAIDTLLSRGEQETAFDNNQLHSSTLKLGFDRLFAFNTSASSIGQASSVASSTRSSAIPIAVHRIISIHADSSVKLKKAKKKKKKIVQPRPGWEKTARTLWKPQDATPEYKVPSFDMPSSRVLTRMALENLASKEEQESNRIPPLKKKTPPVNYKESANETAAKATTTTTTTTTTKQKLQASKGGSMKKGSLPTKTATVIKALYPYWPTAPNQISMTKGETFTLLDDTGKWWKVRTASGTAEGLVPSNYVEREDAVLATGCVDPAGRPSKEHPAKRKTTTLGINVTPTKETVVLQKILGYVPRTLNMRADYEGIKCRIDTGSVNRRVGHPLPPKKAIPAFGVESHVSDVPVTRNVMHSSI